MATATAELQTDELETVNLQNGLSCDIPSNSPLARAAEVDSAPGSGRTRKSA